MPVPNGFFLPIQEKISLPSKGDFPSQAGETFPPKRGSPSLPSGGALPSQAGEPFPPKQGSPSLPSRGDLPSQAREPFRWAMENKARNCKDKCPFLPKRTQYHKGNHRMRTRTFISQPKKHLASRTVSIITVMLGTLSSRVLGFARNAIIAFYFGAGEKADVLHFVQAIPLMLRRLAAEGSLETALVPELTRSREQDPSLQSSKAIWRKLLAINWSLIFPLCLVLFVFPGQIIALLTEFPSQEQTDLATQMLYYVVPYIFLLSQSVLLGALLSSQERFTLSSFTPLLSSIGIISSTIFLQKSYGMFAVLIGMLVGMVFQLCCLLPSILRTGYSFIPDFRLRDPAISRIGQVWLPLWLSTSLLALMQFTANYLASQSQSGSVSALTNALIFFQLPQGLIYASIAKVCLPQMSQSNSNDASRVLRYGLNQLAILFLPATLILIIMSEPLIAIAFQRGAFRLQDTLLTAEVLRYYALGSLPIALFRFLQQYLYSRSHKFQPLLQTFLVALIDIPLSFYLVNQLGVIGLPIANTLSYTLLVVYSYYITSRHSSGLLCRTRWRKFSFNLFPKLLLICATLWLVDTGLCYGEQYFFTKYSTSSISSVSSIGNYWWAPGSSLRNFSILAVHGLLLLICFGLMCRILHIPLLHQKASRQSISVSRSKKEHSPY